MKSGHPWVFRSKISSAAEAFPDGQWLQLVDGQNHPVGFGVFHAEGLIGVRAFSKGNAEPNLQWWKHRLQNVLAKRENLRNFTDSFRAVNGDNDKIPGVVIDVYGGKYAVLQTYADGVDGFGRYVAQVVAKELGIDNILWKIPTRRRNTKGKGSRTLRGEVPTAPIPLREGKVTYFAELSGQKSGTFLDLRGLRKWVSSQKWQGKRVLNLFSYTATLGYAAELAGASEVWNVDTSKGALDFGQKYHSKKKRCQKYIVADIFQWINELSMDERFDVIICDPPSMASDSSQVGKALKVYRSIYRELCRHLKPKGILIGCCCTSRISREQFRREMDGSFGGRLKFEKTLPPEDDHPVGFPEGDYLKVNIYRS